MGAWGYLSKAANYALGLAAPKALAQKAYDKAYGDPADQVKQGYQKAADDTRGLGQNLSNIYSEGAKRGQSYYDLAGDVYASGGGSGSAPTYSPYPQTSNSTSRISGNLNPSGMGGNPLSSSLGKGTGLSSLAGGPSMAPQGGSYTSNPTSRGMTSSQDYYSNYKGPTNAQDYATKRAAEGYGPDAVSDRYKSRSSAPDSSYLEDNLGYLSDFAKGGTETGTRMDERRAAAGTPDQLDKRLGERYGFTNQPTNTSSALTYLSSLTPGGRTQGVSNQVQGFTPDQNSGAFANQLSRGETASGRVLNDLTTGNTAGGKMLSSMQAGQGDTGKFLAGFDPNQTQGLGKTYEKLAAEGPTYEEDFYTSQLAGDNPAYNQLKADTIKQAQRSSATRGGFGSGVAIDNENRAVSHLAADEFARRGELAASAGDARRARLGQELSGAEALDSNLLGRSTLQANVGMNREGTMAGLAGQGDTLRAGLAGDTDKSLADLSKFRDTAGLDKLKTLGDLSQFQDTEQRLNADQRLKGAGQQDTLLRQDQDALDSLTGDMTARDKDRNAALDSLARDTDSTRTSRVSDYAGNLGTADVNKAGRARDLDALAGAASSSDFDRQRAIDELAGKGADEAGRNEDRKFDASKASSDEARDAYKTRFDQAIRMGDSRSAIDQVYTMAQAGALSTTELSAIGQELAKAGVDAATIQAVITDALSVIKEGTKIAALK